MDLLWICCGFIVQLVVQQIHNKSNKWSLSFTWRAVQDVQYADIDHYDNNKVFTIDEVSFAGLSEYFDQLRREGLRTVIILVRLHHHHHHHHSSSLLSLFREVMVGMSEFFDSARPDRRANRVVQQCH